MNNRQQRLNFFLVVWFTMISFLTGWGQNNSLLASRKNFLDLRFPGAATTGAYPYLPINVYQMIGLPSSRGVEEKGVNVQVKQDSPDKFYWGMNEAYIPPSNIYYIQSGFFCKREWEFEKVTHIPFRFRLGSLAECNAMEGKN
jgi:hypothetical protein